MGELTKILLVEGIDDAYVFEHLLSKKNLHYFQQIKKSFGFTVKTWPESEIANYRSEDVVAIVSKDSKGTTGRDAVLNNLVEALESDTPSIFTVGLVIDNDEDKHLWDAVINRIKEKFPTKTYLPSSPMKGGLITTVYRKDRPDLKLGIWVMPNNQDEGGLESFFAELIDDSLLWPKAQETLDEVFVLDNNSFRFPSTHRKKAEVATWLAWQKKVNRRLGETISSGRYLNLNHPSAQSFVEWVTHLFSPEN